MKTSFFSLLGLLALMTALTACSDDDCNATTWYQDADGDGLGNPTVVTSACDQPNGFVANSNDSDDTVNASETVTALGEALENQIDNGDGNGIDGAFRNSGIVVNEATNTYFAVNGVHPVNNGDYTSYYPKSIVEASISTDEIVNVWSFDNTTLGREVDMEGLTFAEGSDKLYIGDEYNFIYELDLTTGTVTREWNLADIGISTDTDRGVEAISYRDGSFYVGIQADRTVIQLDLHLDATDPNDADYQVVESISSFGVSNNPSGLYAASDGTFYLTAFGAGDVGQSLYQYTADGILICTIDLPSEVALVQADGVYIDSNEEFVYVADSQGMLNGLSGVYRIAWSALECL